MKTDISHFPPHRQAELKVIANMLALSFADVEMIFLINADDVKNGYHLLVILTRSSKANNLAYTSSITSAILHKKLITPCIPLFHGIDVVNQELDLGNPFFIHAKENGILLFSSERFQLSAKK